MQIILASASPRRRELLEQLAVNFSVMPADIDETPRNNELPSSYVMRMAREKAQAILAAQTVENAVVIGSDTSVVMENQIFGKPENKQHAIDMLSSLSGATHQVLTAVTVAGAKQSFDALSQSDVTFRRLSADELEHYWSTKEPLGKAGGYAIQGFAARFIQHLSGSYSGVMGLPLFETASLLTEYGYDFTNAPRNSD